MSIDFHAKSISTKIFKKNDSLIHFLREALGEQSLESSVVAITSKIVSLSENQVVSMDSISKKELVEKEADKILCDYSYGTSLTLKHGIFMPAAGIDESNSENGEYLLLPKDPWKSAREIRKNLMDHFKLKNFGVILTDSHSSPLRRGVTGIALSYDGFRGNHDLKGKKDLFGRKIQMSSENIADALASAAVFCMGEASESCPLAIVRSSKIQFVNQSHPDELLLSPENDLYAPFFNK